MANNKKRRVQPKNAQGAKGKARTLTPAQVRLLAKLKAELLFPTA